LIACSAGTLNARGQPPPQDDYLAEYSTVPMIRNAALADVGVRLIERGVDEALDLITGDFFGRKSPGAFAARLGRWLAFDFFVGTYGSVVAHEFGHDTRAEELGRTAQVSIKLFHSAFTRTSGAPLNAKESLSVSGAGFEGARVLADRIERRIYTRNRATYADMTMLFMTVLSSEIYRVSTLSERRLETPRSFLGGGPMGLPGDAATYALNLTAVRLSRPRFAFGEATMFFPQIQATAREIRRASFLNLVDAGLLTGTFGLFTDYMWSGRRDIPVRWLPLGPVSLMPALRYELTPNGPEHQVRSHYKVGAHVGLGYVRWSGPLEPLQPDVRGLWGIGGEYTRATNARVAPRFATDIWRDVDGKTRGRAEVGATATGLLHRRLTFTIDAGVKGDGYLRGYALRGGPYLTVGGGIRF
jgi:hypothetical protein